MTTQTTTTTDLSPTAQRVYDEIARHLRPIPFNGVWLDPSLTAYGDCYWAARLGLATSAVRPIVRALVRRGLLSCDEEPASLDLGRNRLYHYRLGADEAVRR